MGLIVRLGLTISAASITTGVALWSVPAAFIVGGLLSAGLAFLFFFEVRP